MIRRRSHPEASVSARRTEAFTDGVFAIAATLLVLGLTDQSLGTVRTNDDLAEGLLALAHPVFSFVISFLILCVMWMTHVRQFEWIVRIDDTGMWLNNARLLLVVLVPFTSSLNTSYDDLLLGRILLPINFFLAIVVGWLQWVWAVRSGATVDLTPDDARRLGRAGLSAVVISAGAVALSPWVGSLAFLLFALDGPLTRRLRGADAPVAPATSSPTDGGVEGRG
ncbi:predicted integral membrane protein [Microbacterium testaceum StLB037]|uniref:Predicted integral membrane protein n=1 Tax=Microbacterium testaceum (strain StLB037) TaxID=979556 RepID=E8NDT8_MICTS|nr:TMEM175 family protein [Microbacterium testaceum]BAJ73764.1 predicted integral membrane protein [Microbacterium testaceum StLB037]